ncbi:capsular biosynthesis protein [Microbulbifer agarilyticus]|uniref:capsule biosynthesis protein n=1 Tax=Microbulbifer agarilyticus TaxID=260552 RepID=UPI001C98B277|nr:capsular biosynthesis protein [Microbulbifer agarilyticus]MBY6190519.1 capsular biosynthesis protein [Microbulbifer agarilyticus]
MSGVVFLQGPHGPFFARCARYFSARGIETHKINFNGGDRLFGWADHQVDYVGGQAGWPEFFAGYLRRNDIRAVVVYGDCRYYHRKARTVCDELGVSFWACEEGYLRPDFVTLEQGGVNAFSGVDWSRDAIERYVPQGRSPSLKVGRTFWQRARYAICYYFAVIVYGLRFNHYRHHRPRAWWQEAGCWLRSFYRKGLYRITERNYTEALVQRHGGEFFLFPLQTADDFQVREHSDVHSLEDSIRDVIASFALNAANKDILVIKHHPMDRGFCHYGKLIQRAARDSGVDGRVAYCHDLHLPTLLDHAKGVVTINSTVGISALLHRVPTITLGRALYDIPGMTHQGELSNFWTEPEPVDMVLFRAFRTYLYEQTQLDGSFSKHIDFTVPQMMARMLPSLKAAQASVDDAVSVDDEVLAA